MQDSEVISDKEIFMLLWRPISKQLISWGAVRKKVKDKIDEQCSVRKQENTNEHFFFYHDTCISFARKIGPCDMTADFQSLSQASPLIFLSLFFALLPV